ncbi:hypothetical protein JX266_010006 [Neoarthrinium moseri]|nr:hypothetical protein JX266_010006 [Neoarthrinium moseri]
MAAVHKVALVQLNPKAVDPAANFAKAEGFIRDAAAKGAHLAVLPEYHLTSWVPDDPGFKASCADWKHYLAKYQNLAKELSICIVPGTIVELVREGENEILRNIAYFISSDGEIAGRYQKKNLWHPERRHLVSSAHEPHEAFDTPLGRVGLLICWDLAFTEAFRELISDGAQLIIVPTFWTMKDVTDEGYALNPDGEALFLNSTVISRAFENTCGVIFVNAGGPPEKEEKTNYAGLSQVALPHVGSVGRMGRAEGMNIVDLDMDILRVAEDNYKQSPYNLKMSSTLASLAALTTVFTPPPSCAGRYAVFIGSPTPIGGALSTNTPSSGWIDPSFSSCVPPEYTNTYPTFSPGVCPSGMSIISSASDVQGSRTVWTGACCQSGFETMEIDPRYICTSSVTTPMGFLLDPNISTTDIYTTMSNLQIEHDQLMVVWEESDLAALPTNVAVQYASIMGVVVPTPSSSEEEDTNSSLQPAGTSVAPQVAITTSSSESLAGSQGASSPRSATGELTDFPQATAAKVSSAVFGKETNQLVIWTCLALILKLMFSIG